jgi:hypothetical protein
MSMARQFKPDLSSAYGDRDDTLSWPALLYTLTIGWAVMLGKHLWLEAKARRVSSDGHRLRLVKPIPSAMPRR